MRKISIHISYNTICFDVLSQHLEKLVHFVGVVKHGSIRKYTIQQQLSQPAISKCIQNLEAALEVTLFMRGREGITMTQAGQKLFVWAEATLAQSSEIEKSIRRHNDLKLNGSLKMGTYQSIAIYFVPKFFKFIQKEQEGIELQLTCTRSAELVEMLRSGHLDFIVSIDPPQNREFFNSTLFEDHYSLYRAKDSKWTSKNAPIFTLPKATDKNGVKIEEYLKKVGLNKRIIPCGDFEAAKALVDEDVGIAILPERVAKTLLFSRRIEELRIPRSLNHFGSHTIAFSCKKHRFADASLRWIAEQLQLMIRSEF
jgi:DNA-binding transcriptional LysR family regulator